MIIYKGETATCTNGHAIFDAAKDWHQGEPFMINLFSNWRHGEVPNYYEGLSPKCPICQAYWLSDLGLYVDGRWSRETADSNWREKRS